MVSNASIVPNSHFSPGPNVSNNGDVGVACAFTSFTRRLRECLQGPILEHLEAGYESDNALSVQ